MSEFTDNIVVKIGFVLLVIIVMVVLFSMGSKYFTSASSTTDPVLIKGMINAEEQRIISTNASMPGSIPIERSQDQSGGITFSWSVWLYIADLQYGMGKYKTIFYKGNDNIKFDGTDAGLNFPNNGPGLYIAPNTNDLVVIMNTYSSINERVIVPNLPMNKWFHVALRVEGENLDVYMNGTIAKRHVLSDVPKQNYGDVYVAMNGGFNGYISSLQYFSHALQPGEIQALVDKGPSLKLQTSGNALSIFPSYLSMRWYFQGEGGQPFMANPPEYMP